MLVPHISQLMLVGCHLLVEAEWEPKWPLFYTIWDWLRTCDATLIPSSMQYTAAYDIRNQNCSPKKSTSLLSGSGLAGGCDDHGEGVKRSCIVAVVDFPGLQLLKLDLRPLLHRAVSGGRDRACFLSRE